MGLIRGGLFEKMIFVGDGFIQGAYSKVRAYLSNYGKVAL